MSNEVPLKSGLWSQAKDMALQTPESRNRYVDFLRALSILAVISGHWFMIAPQVTDDHLNLNNMLELAPWTHWLSWGFQVMPIFFLVGGYANGVSWSAAIRQGQRYNEWLSIRLGRLVKPVLPLLLAWMFIGAAGHLSGIPSEILSVASQVALVPIWFLAVYIMVALLVPVTYTAWSRFGLNSFWFLALLALANDAVFFAAGIKAVGWLNYVFVWLAVHQLGYAWRDGHLSGLRNALAWAAGGALLLFIMMYFGPYPIAMVSVPGAEVSNTLPPKFAMLALGITQMGLLMLFESRAQRWLADIGPWAVTILINAMIMTIYLWHLTASTLVIGIAWQFGDIGLDVVPDTKTWWLLRPAWLVAYIIALSLFAIMFSRLEQNNNRSSQQVSSGRLVTGALVVCAGLAILALTGIVGEQWLGLRLYVLCLPFLGAVIAGLIPLPNSSKHG